MIKVGRYPCIGRVTVITLCRGRQVINILAFGSDTVMTTRTSTQHLEVIYRHRRNPGGVAVAVFANVGRTDMLETLAGRRHAIVTAATGLGGRGMIEARGQPGIGRVTVVALCRGLQVINILARGGNAIVTTGTGAQHLGVIHGDCWLPNTGRVAIFANISGADVIQRLTGGGYTIMTITTGLRGDVLMIEVGR